MTGPWHDQDMADGDNGYLPDNRHRTHDLRLGAP
jgi:hypothetical protein